MPTLRTPFTAVISPTEPVVLEPSPASFILYVSGIANVKAEGQAPAGISTLYVQAGNTAPIAVASIASGQPASRVRVVVPVRKGTVRFMVRGPRPIALSGDQHTAVTSKQVTNIGKAAAAAAGKKRSA